MQKPKLRPQNERGDQSAWQQDGPRGQPLPRLICWIFLVTAVVLEVAWLGFLGVMAIWAHRG